MIYQRTRGRIGGRVMSGLNGQHSGRAGMLSGVAAAIAGMTLNWASSPGNLIPPGFSLTRSGTNATYFDSAGLLQTAGANVARGTYRYNGSAWVFDGTMIEAAATNLMPRSNNFGVASWQSISSASAAQNQTGIDGTTSAWTLTDANAAATSFYLSSVQPVLTAANYTIRWYVKKTTGAQASYPAVLVADTVGLRAAAMTIDTSNGIATVWTAYTGYTVNTSSATCVNFSADKWEVRLTFLGNAAAGGWSQFVCPACTANPTKATGSLVDEPALTGTAVFERGQLELGDSSTSYIDNNTDTSTARNADVVTATTAGLLLGTQGFSAIGFRPITAPTTGDILTATNKFMYLNAGQLALNDGTAARDFLAAALTVGTNAKLATTWGGVVCNGAFNGAVGTQRTFDGDMNAGATITLMAGVSGVLQSMRLGVQTVNNSRLANPFA